MATPTTDLTPVLERLDAIAAKVEVLAERQRAQAELIADMTPIAREAMNSAIEKLDAMDRAGYFAFAAEAAGLARRVVEGFSPDDVRQLGDSIVGMLETVRAVTRPDVLDAKPIGLFGAARAVRKDDDVQKGLAVLVEMLRRLGHRAEEEATPPRALDQKARLAAMLGPRRTRRMLPAPAAPAPVAATVKVRPVPAAAAPEPGSSCASPSTGPADPDWTREKGEALAAAQGLALTDAHWVVLETARADYAATQVSPNVRRLTQIAGVTTKDLYVLFPRAPGRTIALIAGLPKPAGCL